MLLTFDHDNEIFSFHSRLLESTRKFLETSEELTVENEAISTAISTFGLKKQSLNMFDENNTSSSDDSNHPSTSSQSQRSSGSPSSPNTMALESDAINSAISSYGLHKNQKLRTFYVFVFLSIFYLLSTKKIFSLLPNQKISFSFKIGMGSKMWHGERSRFEDFGRNF